MADLRHLCIVLVTGCAASAQAPIDPFIDSGKADGGARKLHPLDRTRIDVSEPSDLALVDGLLFTISDAHSKIYEIDLDGDSHKRIDFDYTDTEALAFDGERGEFVIAGEGSGRIWHLEADGDRHDPIDIAADDGNSGIEGLAYAPDGHLFVAKEKDPARIYELDAGGEELRRDKITFADDISAITFDADGRLYALSDQERALYRLDGDREVVTAWRLPVEHPEGVALDGDIVYIVSDSEERLYTFELE